MTNPLSQSETEHSRSIPLRRFWKVTLRTAHLIAACILVGGHAFHAPAGQLRPMLYLAVATGIGMVVLEAYPVPASVLEGWGLLLLAKLVLLCLVPFAWNYRLALLIAVVVLASIGSHMPGRWRHYSLLSRKVMKNS